MGRREGRLSLRAWRPDLCGPVAGEARAGEDGARRHDTALTRQPASGAATSVRVTVRGPSAAI